MLTSVVALSVYYVVVLYCHDFSNSLKTISGISEMHKLQKHPFMVLIFVVTCYVCMPDSKFVHCT